MNKSIHSKTVCQATIYVTQILILGGANSILIKNPDDASPRENLARASPHKQNCGCSDLVRKCSE